MTKLLCTPCAAKLAESRPVKSLGGKAQKITCAACSRRRFGTLYEVGRKGERK